MAGRKKWKHPLAEACHSEIFARSMAFLLCLLTCPHLWSMKEPDIQTFIRWLFWDISLHLFSQLALWIKSYSLPQHLISESVVWRAEWAWAPSYKLTLFCQFSGESVLLQIHWWVWLPVYILLSISFFFILLDCFHMQAEVLSNSLVILFVWSSNLVTFTSAVVQYMLHNGTPAEGPPLRIISIQQPF